MATTQLARSPDRDDAGASAAGLLPPGFALRTGRDVVWTWVTSRAAALLFLTLFEGTVSGDVGYYARNLHQLFTGGSPREALQEYPLPVLAIMVPQYLIGALNSLAFAILFAASMLALDAWFTRMLWRHGGNRRSSGLAFWLAFVPLGGAMAYFRFDLVTAVCAGAAVLVAARRPALAGALTAAGAAIKLWPAAMLPILLLRRTGKRAVLAGFVVVGVVVIVGCLLVADADRLVSPLRWQSARGLQVEAVGATPLMLGHAVHVRGLWSVGISRYKAYEIFGTGVSADIAVLTGLTIIGVLLLGWLWWRAYRLGARDAVTVGWLFLATAAMLTITNKTLSPQYVLWLGGPAAALLVLDPDSPDARRCARLLLVIAVLTQLVYPTTYPNLLYVHWLTLPVTAVLAARNVLLVVLTCWAIQTLWRRTRPAVA
jgi:hypothetical protein